MITKEGSTKTVNFITTGQGFLYWGMAFKLNYSEMDHFFKNLLLYSGHDSEKPRKK